MQESKKRARYMLINIIDIVFMFFNDYNLFINKINIIINITYVYNYNIFVFVYNDYNEIINK